MVVVVAMKSQKRRKQTAKAQTILDYTAHFEEFIQHVERLEDKQKKKFEGWDKMITKLHSLEFPSTLNLEVGDLNNLALIIKSPPNGPSKDYEAGGSRSAKSQTLTEDSNNVEGKEGEKEINSKVDCKGPVTNVVASTLLSEVGGPRSLLKTVTNEEVTVGKKNHAKSPIHVVEKNLDLAPDQTKEA